MKFLPLNLMGVLFASLMLFGCTETPSTSGTQVASTTGGSGGSENTLVLVTGITGNQGAGVATALLDQGFQVRGLSRDIKSEKSLAWTARGVEMVQGDFTDRDTITAAVAGVDHLFLNITERTDDFIGAAKHAVDAAYAAGAQHVVFTSNRPADPESGFESNPERTKRMIELHLRESGGSYTTLRIPFMMENLMRERDMSRTLTDGVIDYGEDGTVGYYINSVDMGLLAAAAFANPAEWKGREVNLASDAISYRDLATLLSELSGVEIPFRVAPWSEMRGPFVANFKFFETNPPYDLEEIKKNFPEVRTLRTYLMSENYGEKMQAIAAKAQ